MGRKSLKPTERMCMAYGMVEGVHDGRNVLQGREGEGGGVGTDHWLEGLTIKMR